MAEDPLPGASPVSLDEARSWLRLGATGDDAVVARLIRAATDICEAFVGRWLIVRVAEEIVPVGDAPVRLGVRPVVAVDGVVLLAPDGGETALGDAGYAARIGRDGTASIAIHDRGAADRARIAFRAGMAADADGLPEAIRHGIIRMTQHLHEARDGKGAAPPAAIAALWQPWRRMTLGGG